MCLFSKCLPSASACASSRARHWLMDGVNDALFNAAPYVQQAMTQNIAVTLNDISRVQKHKQNTSKSTHQKCLQIYNTESKSTFDAEYYGYDE